MQIETTNEPSACSPTPQVPQPAPIPAEQSADLRLVAVLLPFRPEFRPVYSAIQAACLDAGLECRRADDLWKPATSFPDLLELLRTAAVVVVDWSDKHPSVMFLAGAAQTLGKTVIPLTQHDYDIPAGLPKIRYIKYQCNRDGFDRLRTLLAERLAAWRQAAPEG